MDHNQDTLGQYLKRQRESLLLPVQEIARALGVKKALIEALEEDDFDTLQRQGQALVLVKQVAAYLKLPLPDVLNRFEHQWRLHEKKKSFPKLSSFAETAPLPVITPAFKERKAALSWRRPQFLSTLRGLSWPRMRLRLPVIIAILLIGLFLVIDLPFSRQKPQPPPDPRFLETDRKAPPAKEVHVPAAPAETAKAEAVPREAPSPRENAPRSVASAERILVEARNGKVVGNSDTKRYHLPGMKHYNRIKAYHRVFFQSEKEAIKAGYRKARE
jgi:hypothetical protein